MPTVGSFDTQEVHPFSEPWAQTSKILSFPKAFVAPPRLALGLTLADMQAGANSRIRAYADNVDSQKFTAHIDTWADSTLYSAEFHYLAERPADLDFQSGEFDTQEDHPWTDPKKETSHRIKFARPFVTPPKVVVFLKAWDMGQGSSSRVKTYATSIDAKGFTIHVDTWADTTLYSAVAGWLAYPEDKEHIFSGTAYTTDVHPWNQPQEHTQGGANFQGTEFWRKPTIFFALNQIDVAADKNLRIKAYVDNISTKGMTWHVDSWADTVLWSGGISYIAFN